MQQCVKCLATVPCDLSLITTPGICLKFPLVFWH